MATPPPRERRLKRQRGPGILLGQLQDPNPLVRRWGVRDLAAYAGAPAVLLAHLARENDDTVREVTLATLAILGGEGVALGLLPFLESEDAALRNGVAQALNHLARETLPHLSPFLAHRQPGVRQLAIAIAGQAPGTVALPLVIHRLAVETHAAVAASLLLALGVLGGAEHLPLLEKTVSRFPDQPFVAFAASQTRGRLRTLDAALAEESFRELHDLALKQTGLVLTAADHPGLQRVFHRQRQANAISGAGAWISLLDRVDHWSLWQEIVAELRPLSQPLWQEDVTPLLPVLIPELFRYRGVGTPLRIWCHSVASGMAGYALADSLSQVPEPLSLVVSTHAPDARERRDEPPEATSDPLDPSHEERAELAREFLRQGVEFRHLDLNDPSQGKGFRGFDLVVCRGILPRLHPLARRQAAILFFDALQPGGLLLLGKGEGMGQVSSLFKIRTLQGSMVYQKPVATR